MRCVGPLPALAALVTLVACTSSPTTPQPTPTTTLTSVTVSGAAPLVAGTTTAFTATAGFSNGTSQNVTATATWQSTNTGVATVSPAGAVTAVGPGSVQIQATFQGVMGTLTVQVNADPPVGRFSVTGPGGTDVCRIIPGTGGDLDCTFDGAASTGGAGGAVTAWIWRYDVGQNGSPPITETDPIHIPTPGCGFFVDTPGQSGNGFVQMIVKLQVQNAAGDISGETRNANVRLFPQGQCGFGF